MTIARGRVLKASVATARAKVLGRRQAPAVVPEARVVRRDVAEASSAAQRLLEQAKSDAEKLIADARATALEIRAQAEDEGRKAGGAELAAHCIRLSRLEALTDERALERSIALATLLAERLLGETLSLEPSRVVALARTALAEARGARDVQIHAHPEDCPLLQREAEQLELSGMTIHPDRSLGRGELRIETELGTLDARFTPEIERLAIRLRQSLRAPG